MKNIIDYLTIKSTINELTKTENVALVDKLLDILNNNKIAKPEKHNKKEDIDALIEVLKRVGGC
jgi:adenosyl cobinamide kinase/adenosyl cobinamide phosphate guanylyltransferase